MAGLGKSLSWPTIAGGLLLAGGLAGGGYWLADRTLDRQVEQWIEAKILATIGTTANCEGADAQFFRPLITLDNCQLDNLPGFPSPYLVKVGRVEIESQQFRPGLPRPKGQPMAIDRLTLVNVDLHLDLKADLRPQNLLNPTGLVSLNLGEALGTLKGSGDQGAGADPEPSPGPTVPSPPASSDSPSPGAGTSGAGAPRFAIGLLEIRTIKATVTLPAALPSPPRSLNPADVVLNDVNQDTLAPEVLGALRADLQGAIAEDLAVAGRQALGLLLPLIQQGLQNYFGP